MHSLNRPPRHPLLKIAVTAWLAALLIGWLAAGPGAVLNFWPGVLMGTLAAIVGWHRWRSKDALQRERCFRFFATILLVWFSLVFVPQRDILVITAPCGIWMALMVVMALEQFQWRRSRSV